MARRQYELVAHKFSGGLFADHGIDVDALPDLIAYKTLLVETAKEIWRRNHPERQRLPKNFEDSLALKFYRIQEGSAVVPLMREIEVDETSLPFELPRDELDEAVELVAETIQGVSLHEPLPNSFPKNLIPLFAEYGKTLREDESFEHNLPKRDLTVRYSLKERDCLLQFSQVEYEDRVDLIGELRLADLDGSNFAMRLADGTKVVGKFSSEQEMVITDALREHASRRLRIKGDAEFQPDGKLKRIVSISELSLQAVGLMPYDATARPIWEIAEEISASVPDEEWARVPADLSKNLEHYLYGAPKEE